MRYMVMSTSFTDWESEHLAHYGVKGQKWGVQRFEDEDPRFKINRSPQKVQYLNQRRNPTSLLSKNASASSKIKYAINNQADKFGRYGRGNIDLNNRKVVRNKDGSISTERSFSVNIDGKETLLPTVVDGKIVSEDEAIDHYYKTGEHLGRFDTVEEAEAYAEELHKRQDRYYNRDNNDELGKKSKNSKKKNAKSLNDFSMTKDIKGR